MLDEDNEQYLEKAKKEINDELTKRLKQNGIVTGTEFMKIVHEKLGLRLNPITEYGFNYYFTIDENGIIYKNYTF